jgi:eukaryotic-like serine/threonine-protein kinase
MHGLGRETVVNPEGRPGPVVELAALEGSSIQRPLSGLARTLFPGVPDGEAPPLEATEAAPLRLGTYRVLQRIRSGGMGAVFLGVDEDLGRKAALKVLPPHMSRDPQSVQRFQHEARAGAQLNHESIARVYSSGVDQGLYYIAFEFIEGTNIRDVLSSGQPLAVGDAIRVTYQIAVALRHMARLGVVHRDIKPSNIILNSQGAAKLVDFGLARSESRTESQAEMTIAGTTLGTFDYISPEQARDPRQADVRSDIYSLGCTLYHMLTGEPPYPEGTMLQKLLQHQGDEAPDPSKKNRKVPAALAAIVRTMMAKDARKRYPSVEPLLRDIALVAAPLGVRLGAAGELAVPVMREPGPLRRFFDRHLVWLASAGALVALALGLEFGFRGGVRRAVDGAATSSGKPATGGTGTRFAGEASRKPRGLAAHAVASLFPNQSPGVASTGQIGLAQAATVPGATSSGTNSERSGVPRPGETSPTSDKPLSSVGDASGVAASRPTGESALTALAPPAITDNRVLPPAVPRDLGLVASNDTGALDARQILNLAEMVRPGPNGTGVPPLKGVAPAREPSPRPSSTGTSGSTAPSPPSKGGANAEADNERAPYLVRGKEGAVTRFASLEAACAGTSEGGVVELRFSGVRREGVCKVNHRLSIRAARGFRPVLEFVPVRLAADGWLTRMIVVTGGGLDLSGVELRYAPLGDSLSAGGALVSVQRADYLRVTDCALTVAGGTNGTLAAIELDPSAAMRMPDMDMDRGTGRVSVSLEIERCLIRGRGDGVHLRGPELARILLRHSVVALAGTFLKSSAGTDSSAEQQPNELRIDRCSVATSGGLLRLDSGRMPKRALGLAVRSSDSILAGYGASALVMSTGEAPRSDQRSLLTWSGRRNFYSGYVQPWSIGADDPTATPEQVDLAVWRQKWSETEADSPVVSAPWSAGWSDEGAERMTAASFTLAGDAVINPAIGGADNGEDAGADLRPLAPLGLVDERDE